MISTSDLHKGVVIELDGDLWQILDYHHLKIGRGSAQVRIKLRNVKRGQTVERSFQAGDKWPRAQLDHRQIQFLYRDGNDFHFMETESYDQFHLTAEQLDDAVSYLYDPLHPSVLRLIHMTIRAGVNAGIPVAMCGEMAGDTRYTRLLLGLGLREFSMHPSGLLQVKKIVMESEAGELERHAEEVLAARDTRELHELVENLNSRPG